MRTYHIIISEEQLEIINKAIGRILDNPYSASPTDPNCFPYDAEEVDSLYSLTNKEEEFYPQEDVINSWVL